MLMTKKKKEKGEGQSWSLEEYLKDLKYMWQSCCNQRPILDKDKVWTKNKDEQSSAKTSPRISCTNIQQQSIY